MNVFYVAAEQAVFLVEGSAFQVIRAMVSSSMSDTEDT